MRFVFAVCVLAIIACNSSDQPVTTNETTTSTENNSSTSIERFTDSVAALQESTPNDANRLAKYFEQLVPTDSTLADSAAVTLLAFMNDAAQLVNEKLSKDTSDYARLKYVVDATPTPAQKAFLDELKAGHFLLQADGEGGVVAEPDYGWIKNTVQAKTSTAVDDYISLLQREAINPAVLDAGIAIEMRSLIDRAAIAERLTKEKLPAPFAERVITMSDFYKRIALFGTDNTPALQNERSFTLSPEFQQGYDYALATYPSSTLASTIKEWQTALRTKSAAKVNALRTMK